MGCHKFQNYKHILQISRNGEWVDGRKFPPSLRAFMTIPKSKCGQPFEQTQYHYLDAVHMDIAFCDCLSVGGFCYALIIAGLMTQYNWSFGLKDLSLDSALGAIQDFCAMAGSLALCFYCDCDAKLFGHKISNYLIGISSKVVVTPAKCQLANSLVESHWKVPLKTKYKYWQNKLFL
jgi:hypothetical protein